MPEKRTLERARKDRREGKSASTQAGEFVREEIHHIREGKHGARSAKQAIAIGLSKARRAGVELELPEKGKATKIVRRRAERDLAAGHAKKKTPPSRHRSRATERALERESTAAGSRTALALQTRSAARERSASDRSAAARKAARTKGPAARAAAARKAARTRAAKRGSG